MSIEPWFLGQWSLSLAGSPPMKPARHPMFSAPVEITRGQASNYLLDGSDGTRWFLKSFKKAMRPEDDYVAAVASLVPRGIEMSTGFERRVVSASTVTDGEGHPFTNSFVAWLDGTVLSPKAGGMQWSDWLTRLSDSEEAPSAETRRRLVLGLISAIARLEAVDVSHRDLSGGNVLVDGDQPHLIDWDTACHRSLSFQSNTPVGSTGYMAPWLGTDAAASWSPRADRFSLAILIMECLSVTAGTKLVGDGNLFRQQDLGKGDQLRPEVLRPLQQFGSAAELFRETWLASSFDDCPSPSDWAIALGAPEVAEAATRFASVAGAIDRAEYSAAIAELEAQAQLRDLLPSRLSGRLEAYLESTVVLEEALLKGDLATLARLDERGVIDWSALRDSAVVDVGRARRVKTLGDTLAAAVSDRDRSSVRAALAAYLSEGGIPAPSLLTEAHAIAKLPRRWSAPQRDPRESDPIDQPDDSAAGGPGPGQPVQRPEAWAVERDLMQLGAAGQDWETAARSWWRLRGRWPAHVMDADRQAGGWAVEAWGAQLNEGRRY